MFFKVYLWTVKNRTNDKMIGVLLHVLIKLKQKCDFHFLRDPFLYAII